MLATIKARSWPDPFLPTASTTLRDRCYQLLNCLMILHSSINPASVRMLIRQQKIAFAGNRQLKIYGTLQCKSGKRMNKQNRVFFTSEHEAGSSGYRPCGHCLREAYKKWKVSSF
jgi:hypothetical protein